MSARVVLKNEWTRISGLIDVKAEAVIVVVETGASAQTCQRENFDPA